MSKLGFVVEGFNDEAKLMKLFPDASFAVTKGTRMNNRVKMDVSKLLKECDEVLLMLDPDEAGDQLSSMVKENFPELKQVHLEREHCLCQRGRKLKVGVEHASVEYLKRKLKENNVIV